MANSNSKDGGTTPWLFTLRSSYGYIIATLAIAFFFDTFYYGLVIPILPQLLTKRIGIGSDDIQIWTSVLLATYCIAQLLSAPIVGYVADKWSNRRVPLLVGLIALAATNAMFAFAKGIGLLVVARFLQGTAAAVIWAVGLALLVDTVGSHNIQHSMSWVTISLSVGLASGPLLGGIIYQRAGHYAVFIVASAILLVDLVLRVTMIEKKDARKIVQADQNADGTEETEEPSDPGQTETTPLIRNELNEPQKPKQSAFMSLLSDIELLIGLWALFIGNTAQTALETVLPLYLQQAFGWNSENSALVLLALMLPAFTGPIAGYFTDRYGPRTNTIFGLLCIAVPFPLLALVTNQEPGTIALLCTLLVLIGTGVSFINVAQMSTIAAFAEMKEKKTPGIFGPSGATAQSCALINWAYATAGVAGPAISGSLNQMQGWQVTCYVMGIITTASIIPMFRLSGKKN